MSQRGKLTLIGIGIIALLIVPVLIQVTRSLYSLQNTPPPPTENPLQISEMDSWETYHDQEAGFLIKYPPEMYPEVPPFEGYSATFLLLGLKQLRDLGLPDEVSPRIQVFASDMSVDEFLTKSNEMRNAEQFPEFAKIDLDDYEAYQTKAFDREVIFTHTIVGNEEKSFLFELFSIEKENHELRKAYEEMLSTFEIL